MFGNNKVTGFARIAKPLKSKSSICVPNNAAFEGKLVQVIERNPDGDCLCLANEGMGNIDAVDVDLFIPVEKNITGKLIPTNLSFIEKMNWSALAEMTPYYNAAYIYFAGINNRNAEANDYKAMYKLCDQPNDAVIALSKVLENKIMDLSMFM